MIKSKTITNQKLLKDVHEESLQNPRQNSQFLYNRPDEAFEDVRTSEQHRPDVRATPSGRQVNQYSTRSWISEVDTVWEVSASRQDDVATRPADVQYFRIFQSSVQTQKGF
jgi:hypothetical protein